MIAVIFEVWPLDDGRDAYLERASALRPVVETAPGFLGVERFESLTAPGKLLSLSFFEDEAALKVWRSMSEHQGAQAAGRHHLFEDYRLRVAEVQRDYGMHRRDEAPEDLRAREEPPAS